MCLADSWIGWLVGWMTDWLVGWCTGWMVGRWVGLVPLVDQSVIWSAACLFGGLVGLSDVCVTHSVGRSVIESFG